MATASMSAINAGRRQEFPRRQHSTGECAAFDRSFTGHLIGFAAAKAQRESERHAGADFVDRMAVHQRMAQADIDGQVLAHLPYRADKSGDGARLAELFLVEDLRHGPHGPFGRSFDDRPNEEIGAVLAREGSGSIEVHGTPVPALRDDAGDACTETILARAVREQYAEFRSDAWSFLVLQASRP